MEYSAKHTMMVGPWGGEDTTKSQPVFNQISHDEPKINEVARIVPSVHEKFPPKNVKAGVVKSAACGGHGGSPFDDGVYDGIMQINVYRNVAINSIRVCYDRNGKPVWGSKNGGMGSIWADKVNFESRLRNYYKIVIKNI